MITETINIAESIEEVLQAWIDGKKIVFKKSNFWKKDEETDFFPSVGLEEINSQQWTIKD